MPEEKGPAKARKPRKLAALAAVSLLSAALVFLADLCGWLEPVENKAYDGLVYLRAKVRPPADRPEAPVAVIGADDRTFNTGAFQIPVILWHRYLSAVILALGEGGAKAVGLDYLLPRALFDDVAPDFSRVWLRTLVMARKLGTPVITGFIDAAERPLLPEPRYLQIIGRENIGVFNLTTDSDDFIRRQQLFFPSGSDPAKGNYSITHLLAKTYDPGLTTPGNTIYIDFNSAPNPFPRYSLAEVYQHAQDGDKEYFRKNFQGKVVLLGETDLFSSDRHATPLYYLATGPARRTPGVEILAQTVLTLLSGKFFRETPAGGRAALYLALALIAAALMLHLPSKMALPVFTPLFLLLWLGLVLGAFLGYRILPAASGLAAYLLSQGAAFSYRYLVVDREKRMIRNAFSLYLSPQVVAEVIKNPEQLTLGGSRRLMTVFFSDLAGFTSISEALAPEDLVHLLNRYLGLMTSAIMAGGGTVDKYEGDAIMAFWGAPAVQEDHALRACLAALRQQELLAGFREEALAEGLPRITARMGLNTGPMIVGNMGSEERFDYTVMGDAVNLASRLEGANKQFGTSIMISESTYEMVQGQIEVRELDLLRVKGKDQPIRVYELLSRNGGLSPEKKDVLEAYARGLALYRDLRFAEAEAAFQRALELDPDDGPSRTYVQRCRAFQAEPPPPDWDRVFTLTTK
ncbi:MAG: adenylate/guanylate cyclase domain-containing protein [Thermodesulfobacteriota bacterium]